MGLPERVRLAAFVFLASDPEGSLTRIEQGLVFHFVSWLNLLTTAAGTIHISADGYSTDMLKEMVMSTTAVPFSVRSTLDGAFRKCMQCQLPKNKTVMYCKKCNLPIGRYKQWYSKGLW
jgi:hypothetical protein